MRRSVWVAGVLAVSIAACGELGTELLPVASTSTAAGGSASSGQGDGGAGGSAGGDAAGGQGGEGGSSCVPTPDPCPGLDCGEVFDGCQMVSCGGCAMTEMCNKGLCCTPKTQACDRLCGPQGDGCGGTFACDDVCGDGSLMTCQGGVCACADAMDSPDYEFAVSICSNKVAGSKPYYCGKSPNPDAPAGCTSTGFDFKSGEIWCCI